MNQAREAIPEPPRNAAGRAGRDLRSAILVGAALGLTVIAILIWWLPGWLPLVALAMATGTWEVYKRLRQYGYDLPLFPLLGGGQAMIWLGWTWTVGGSSFGGTRWLLGAFVVTVLVVAVWRLFHLGMNKAPVHFLRDVGVTLFVLAWIPLLGALGVQLAQLPKGALIILTFMVCVVGSDVGGYGAGVFFGRHAMAQAISPKKSWEGFGGSLAAGILAGVLLVTFALHRSPWIGVALGAALVVTATLGDLVESQVKRDLGIKDMGTLLPGHGGIMDRLDGMLPAAAVTWVIFSLVGA